MARKPKVRLFGILKEYKDDLDQVLASAGDVVEVIRSERDEPEWKWECTRFPKKTGSGMITLFYMSDKLLRQYAVKVVVAPNRFQNEDQFRIALFLDFEETVRQLMERKVDEWLEDNREQAASCLTYWVTHGYDLSQTDTLVAIAESQFDEAT